MWFVKLIVKLIYRIIKFFKWPGVFFILLCIELMILPKLSVWLIFESTSGNTPETLVIDAKVEEVGINDEGQEGQWICVTITNSGFEKEIVKIGCKGKSPNYLTYDYESAYMDIDKNDPWYTWILGNTHVPPGTEITLRFFITQDILNEVEGDQLIFRDVVSGKSAVISIEDWE